MLIVVRVNIDEGHSCIVGLPWRTSLCLPTAMGVYMIMMRASLMSAAVIRFVVVFSTDCVFVK